MHRIVRHADRLRMRVVTVDGPGARGFDATSGLDVQRVGLGAGRRLAVATLNARALGEAARFHPAAVLSGHIVTAPAAALIAPALRIPLVRYLHAAEVRGRPRLATFAMRRADATVAVSAYTRELAVANGAAPARVHHILPGVDLPEPDAAERAERPTILTIARLSERYKGHDVMLDAASAAAHPRASLTSSGSSSATGRCWPGSSASPPARRSRAPRGRRARGARCRRERGGRAGRRRPRQTGVLVDPVDHVALADAIADLLLDLSRAEALGAAGARRARELAWPAVARRVEDLVLGLLAGGRPSVADNA